jgi:DNA-binding CsgD family transcriptional regulator
MGAGGAVGMAGPLLERDKEVEAIRAAVASARRGEGRLLVVRGAAGIGKSRLLAEALSVADEAGVVALSARGSQLEREFGFGVTLQLFERLVEELDRVERPELLSGAADLASSLITRRVPPADDSFAVIHGLFWLTSNLAERGPLLLVVDDAHWSDAPTLRYLLHLGERLEDLPIALLASLRSGDPASQEGVAAELANLSAAKTLTPRPLSEAAVKRLAREADPEVTDDFVRACHELSRGNPFLVRELLREAARSKAWPSVQSVTSAAPRSVTLAALAQIARLPGRATELSEVVAVLGDGVAAQPAAALAQLPEKEASLAADALKAAEIFGPGAGLGFAHPLIRASVYDSIPRSRRYSMHLEAARLLRDMGHPAEQVASHLLLAARGGARWVAESLLAAARTAMDRGAPDSAATLLRRALAEPPPAPLRARVLRELGRAESHLGLQSAPKRLEAALELLADPGARASTCYELGTMLGGQGRFEEAASAFERGLSELDPARDDDELAVQLEAGWISAARLRCATRDAAAARLERLRRRRAPSTAMERVLLATLAFELSVRAEPPDEAVELARQALEGGWLLRDETAGGLGFISAATALGYAELLDEAARAFTEAIARAGTRGSVHDYARASVFRAFVNQRLGQVQEAIADAQAALEHAVDGSDVAGPATHAALAQGLIEAGDVEAAEQALESPAGLAQWADRAPYAYFLEARARLRWLQGDAHGALEDLLECGRLLDRLRVTNPAVIAWRSQAALAANRDGEEQLARRLVKEEEQLARASRRPAALGIALRARGLVEGGDQGLTRLEQAARALGRSQAKLERARALAELGAALRRAGRRGDCREPLRQALALARGGGATALATTVEEELAASGARRRRGEPSGGDALTPSERRVARMAAEGMTNRQIAEALFVTLKTVGWHLGNAYRKLGVESREELAALLSSEDDHSGA